MISRFVSYLFFCFMFAGVISCKKKNDNPPQADPILTLNFTNKFIPDQIPVIVFISAADGKIIIDTTCSLNGTYTLYPPVGKVIPEKFMVTVVSSELFWHNLIAHINTYASVDKGAIWTLQGTIPDTLASSHITLENLPEISGPILFSGNGFYNLTFNPTNRSIWNYQVPDNLYVKIQTEVGQFYKYEENLMSGGEYIIDMSTARPTENQYVTLPFQVENYEAKVYAFQDDNYDFPIPVLADYLISDGLSTENIQLNYPPAVFSGFHTSMMIQKTYMSDVSWYCQTEGAIPDEFVTIDAEILSMEPETGKLTVQTGGSFDMVAAHWQFIDHALLFYEWQVYAPDTSTTIILPEIPDAFTTMFPSISLDSLNFQYSELTDFRDLSGYNELINKIFDPMHPVQMTRYNASTIRKSIIPVGKK